MTQKYRLRIGRAELGWYRPTDSIGDLTDPLNRQQLCNIDLPNIITRQTDKSRVTKQSC